MTCGLHLPEKRLGGLLTARSILCLNLLVLLLNAYVLVMQVGGAGGPRTEDYFYSPVTEAEAGSMLSLLRVFSDALREANVTFFMSSGSLLGSLRHHGRVPWDDDIDVIVMADHRHRMSAALERLRPEYRLVEPGRWTALGKWKFFRADTAPFQFQPWLRFRWPYVDIFFLAWHNRSHLRETHYGHLFPRTDVFPLQLRPFDGLSVPVPCRPRSFVATELGGAAFNWSECQSRGFSHVLEAPLPHWRQRRLSCSRLAGKFPFVSVVSVTPHAVREELRLGGKTLREFSYSPPECTGLMRV